MNSSNGAPRGGKIQETADTDIATSIRALFGLDDADPAGLGLALSRFAVSVAGNPIAFSKAMMEYGMHSAQATMAAALRSMGLDHEGPAETGVD
ncbi:MAG: hypothetical protein ACRDSH_06340, partial [Pseudonocardiaceae bacterium]